MEAKPINIATASVIRRATADDAAAIENLYRELVSDPLIRVMPEQIAALSDSPTSFLLVAEAEGAVWRNRGQSTYRDSLSRYVA
jgi:hypothetical protein